MDKAKINQCCARIVSAANQIETRGEENAAQILGICQAARMIAAELRKEDAHGSEDHGSAGGGDSH